MHQEESTLHSTRLYVLTGGPGSGKTTTLRELEHRGIRCISEVARQIIQEQMACKGEALPWSDRHAYSRLMLQRSISSYLENTPGPAFCDRGIPDTLAYLRLIGLDTAEALSASRQYRYARKVFFAPYWEEIYTTDKERKQSSQEARETASLLRSVYEECGYRIIELPLASPQERAEVLLREMENEE